MNNAPRRMLLLRMSGMYLTATMACYLCSAPFVGVLAPVTRTMTTWISPYVDNIRISCTDMTIHFACQVHVPMIQKDGTPLPAGYGHWQKSAWPILQSLAVALTIFVAPSKPIRRRLLALPITLVLTLLFSALQLSIELQSHALQTIGYSWIQALRPPFTATNIAQFKTIESWYRILAWSANFYSGGGGLFLAVWAGLAGHYILPRHVACHPHAVTRLACFFVAPANPRGL